MKSIFTKVQLANQVEFDKFISDNPNIKYIDAILSDLSGIIRGKRLPIEDAQKLFTSGVQFCYSTFLLDTSGYCPDADGRGVTDGDPDANYYPVSNTLKIIPWHKDRLAQVLISIQDNSRYNSIVDPRNLLAQVWDRFEHLKLKANVAFELEFYLISRRKNLSEKPIAARSKRTGKKSEGTQVYSMSDLDDFYDFLEDVNEYCKVQGIPASTASSEFAPGQFEINLNYTDNILKAADDASLLRRVIKETAIKHEYEATFLSKPFINEAGSGMHVHISLFDENNENIFSDEDNNDTKELLYAIGGLQNMMFDSFALFASNQNAYRRFEPDIFVPVNTSWGHNNRSVAFRIPVSNNKAKRIEHRVAGAEANAYLVLASILSGIEDGLINKIKASDPREDNACIDPDPKMPKNIDQALVKLESSELMKKYLSEEYIKVFVDLKKKEQNSFRAEISDIEYKWYLNL